MEEKEVEIQGFNEKEYFLYDTIMTNDIIYDIFAQVTNPNDIIVAKRIMDQEEIYYEILEEEVKDEVISLYQEKKDD